MQKLIKLFKTEKLLDQALTHRSWVNENRGKRETNERLEFLGDAILEFIVSKELYKHFPDKEEGYLTAFRANLVNTINLAKVAKKLGLGDLLYLSKGEEDGGGRENQSLLADSVEAVIGALFIDSGLSAAEQFVETYLLSDLDKKIKEPLKDAKSSLQEKVQSKGLPTPKYTVVKAEGPDHAKRFVIEVLINGEVAAQGQGKSKNQAEQEAAKRALAKL